VVCILQIVAFKAFVNLGLGFTFTEINKGNPEQPVAIGVTL
jgi:hypothetical protein